MSRCIQVFARDGNYVGFAGAKTGYRRVTLRGRIVQLNVNLANYFGNIPSGEHVQQVNYVDRTSGEQAQVTLPFQHFNVESDSFPYEDSQFDVVIFVEIIEHLLNNPCGVLRGIRRVVKPEGILILTTPNVARLENVARTISGQNIYDPYS